MWLVLNGNSIFAYLWHFIKNCWFNILLFAEKFIKLLFIHNFPKTLIL